MLSMIMIDNANPAGPKDRLRNSRTVQYSRRQICSACSRYGALTGFRLSFHPETKTFTLYVDLIRALAPAQLFNQRD